MTDVDIIKGDYNERNRDIPLEIRFCFPYGGKSANGSCYSLMGKGTIRQVTADLLEVVPSRGLTLRDDSYGREKKLFKATIVIISTVSGVIRTYCRAATKQSKDLYIKKTDEFTPYEYLSRK